MATYLRKCWLLIGLGLGVVALGCGRGSKSGEAPTASIPPQASAAANPADASFADSVYTETDNADQLPPPDRTLNGLSTGKLRADVQRLWDEIKFVSSTGNKITFAARFETDDGPMTLALLPDIAPIHVRNFVALARAGYYDGLLFEHVIQQEGDGMPDAKLEMIEGGCPAGTGEAGIGHLGYWLPAEFSETIKHEEGTVGACRGDDPDTAGCRFYITLSKAPVMDGNFTIFGRVTDGLDVMRRIAKRPRPEGGIRPNEPAVIRKVTIQSREVDK
jgi:peptidyl-prolyl cis-trans isomerase B (cyclophilin B)